MIQLFQYSKPTQWLDVLTRDFHRMLSGALEARGRAHVALSGGGTPRPFYQRLNQEPLPWPKIEWWPGDERWVPPSDQESNEKMIRETLGKDHPDFSAHFHSWHLAEEPKAAAHQFEIHLCNQMGNPPIFDLVLLGMGADGHTASLFPNTPGLEEKKSFAMANPVPPLKTTRLTLTYPVLNQALHVWFLIQGSEKKEMVQKLMDRNPEIPSARIRNPFQRIYWLGTN